MNIFRDKKKEVLAPDYVIGRVTAGPISVILNLDEDVQWTWVNNPDGTRKVIGYNVVSKNNKTENKTK